MADLNNEWLTKYIEVLNEVLLDLQKDDTNDPVFHYTSPRGLQGIIENGTLRFTEHFFLNDNSEGTYVLDLLSKNKKEIFPDKVLSCIGEEQIAQGINDFMLSIKDDRFRVFQCSFSLDNDNLSLWNYYTKDGSLQGFNIEFSPQELKNGLKFDEKTNIDGGEPEELPYFYLGRIIYDKEKQVEILQNFTNRIYDAISKNLPNEKESVQKFWHLKNNYLDRIALIGTFFKNPCFKVENEYRFATNIYTENWQPSNIGNKIKFMVRGGLYVPYLELEFNKEAIESITMSPTLNNENTERSLRMFLNNNGIDSGKKIKQSEIPVRF